MKKKRILNLIEALVQLVCLLILFTVPGMVLVTDPQFAWAQDVSLKLGTYTFVDFAMYIMHYQCLALIALMALNALLCFFAFISKDKKRDGVVHTVLAVLIFILSLLYLTGDISPTGYESVPSQILTISGLSCGFVNVVLAIMKRSKYVVNSNENTPIINNIKVDTSDADELKKYKELLDQGVITQEEFDAKKKQLLGL